MIQTDRSAKVLLFLTSEAQLGRLACSTFRAVAQEMEVVWTAEAKFLPASVGDDLETVNLPDLQHAGIVVILQRQDSSVSVNSAFPDWSGRADVWQFPLSPSDDAVLLGNKLANLMIRLILLGGKRQPTAETTVSARPGLAPASSKTPTQKSEVVRVQRESKGRGGKTVTVITGLNLEEAQLQDLAKRLKQLCGTGGTIKDGNIEIQGDQCDRILAELVKKGFKAKRAGG